MKKLLIVLPILLLAVSCSKKQPASSVPSQSTNGEIQSIAIEPSFKNANWTMYSDGAVVKVLGHDLQNVEIKYHPTGTNQSEQSLGQATSLSSQQGAWALLLPQGLTATDVWAEGKDTQGAVVKSQGLGNVGYEKLNSYTSPTALGFSISYPDNFGFNTSYSKVKSLGYIPVCDQTMAACVFYSGDEYKGTNFESAGVSVNVDKNLNTETKCYNFNVSTNEAQNQVADVAINGTAFKSATGGGAGAGHFMKTQVYRNFHNGKCYEIVQRVGSTNIGNYEPGTVKEFNEDEVWQRVQQVVNSFKFAPLGPSASFDGRLEVINPKDGDTISTSFTVTGFAQNWFEGNISYQVVDANGTMLASGSFVVPDNYEKAAYFVQNISLAKTPSSATGILKFNDYSAKDGSLVYSKSINVQFQSVATAQAKNFVLNESVTLKKGEAAYLKGGDASLKLTGLTYAPCPQGARCFWSGLDVEYEMIAGGKTYRKTDLSNPASGAPYQVTVKDTDYKTYATFVVTQNSSASVTVTGTTVCLPHRNVLPGQPQTLECAIGLKQDSTGAYYGLKDSQVPVYEVNLSVQVVGVVEDASDSNYDVVGNIKVVSIKVLK